jgi:hypothetical protein
VSVFLFSLVFRYFHAFEKNEPQYLFNNKSLLDTNPTKFVKPGDMMKKFGSCGEDSWLDSYLEIFEDIDTNPNNWAEFVQEVLSNSNFHCSWPEKLRNSPTPIQFFGFCSKWEENFEQSPLQRLLNFKGIVINPNSDGCPLITSGFSFEKYQSVSEIPNTLYELLKQSAPFPLFHSSKIFSNPKKFFLFLQKFERLERKEYLGGGISGEVVKYASAFGGGEYAVKCFHLDREKEFRREISAYRLVKNFIPTLEMVSFDIEQRILVLFPVLKKSFMKEGRPKVENFDYLIDDLVKLKTINIVHRDIRPENLMFLIVHNIERLVLIDWSSAINGNIINKKFTGTIRYGSDELLDSIINGENYTYKFEDDLCSLVKVFVGKYYGIDLELQKINTIDDISKLASQLKEVWTKAYERHLFIKTLLQLAKKNNYSDLKALMKKIENPVI